MAVDQSAVDLLSLISTPLKRRAGTGGGEYKGPCPKCGGVDRFFVQPHKTPHGRARCRQCKDEWMDPIAFVQWRDGISFIDAKYALGVDEISRARRRAGGRKKRRYLSTMRELSPPETKTSADAAKWIAPFVLRASAIARISHPTRLYSTYHRHRFAEFMRRRGISRAQYLHHQLGAIIKPERRRGSPYIPAGIVIPYIGNGFYTGIEVRTRTGYHTVAGSRKHLFGSPHAAVLVESALDALTLLSHDIFAAATGGTGLKPPISPKVIAFDADDAGDRAAQYWIERGAKRVRPRGGKDIGEMFANGTLRDWLDAELAYALG